MICHSAHRMQCARKSICTKRHGLSDNVDVRDNRTQNTTTPCTIRKKCFAPTTPEVRTIVMCSNKSWNSAQRRIRRTASTTIWRTSTSRVYCRSWASSTTKTTSCPSITISMTPTKIRCVETQGNALMAAATPSNSITPDSGTVDTMICHVSADVRAQSTTTTSTPSPTRQDCTNCASRYTNCHCAGKQSDAEFRSFIYLSEWRRRSAQSRRQTLSDSLFCISVSSTDFFLCSIFRTDISETTHGHWNRRPKWMSPNKSYIVDVHAIRSAI